MGGGYAVITTPDTGSFTRKVMGGKWSHYKLEHVYYFNKNSVYESAKKTGFEIIYYKPFWKVLTLSYLSHVFKKYPLKGVNELFSFLEKIPLVNNIQFPLLIGESMFILKKI